MLVMTDGIVDVNGRVIFFAFPCGWKRLTTPTKSIGYPIYWRKIGNRLKEVIKPFQGDVGTVGDNEAVFFTADLRQRVKLTGVDAVGNHPKALQRNLKIKPDVGFGRVRHRNDMGKCSGNDSLHSQKRIGKAFYLVQDLVYRLLFSLLLYYLLSF